MLLLLSSGVGETWWAIQLVGKTWSAIELLLSSDEGEETEWATKLLELML